MFAVKQLSLLIVVCLTLNVITTVAKSIENGQASLNANSPDDLGKLIVPDADTRADDEDGGSKLKPLDWVWIGLGCLAAMIILSCLIAYLFCECVKTIICIPCTCLKKCLC